jgi:hypothetical protein
MAEYTTVLNQLQHLLPMDQFQGFVRQHRGDRYVKKMRCKDQLTILLYAQATGKDSLRDIETGLFLRDSTWHHLGLRSVARSTLAKANERRSFSVYESLFYELVKRCQGLSSRTALEFSFRNDLKAVDASTVELCLSLFTWAHFRTAKGAIKLHTILDVRSQIPEVVILTEGRIHEMKGVRSIDFSSFASGTIFIFDRGYMDYAFLHELTRAGHHFVIRQKKSNHVFSLGHHRPAHAAGVLEDEQVCFLQGLDKYPGDLRRVTYFDEETKKTYAFLTDEFRLSASNIALIYKQRWKIELFFKWIKQHLKIKTFLGTSKNAVLTQIWVAMIYYLLLSWIKFQTRFKGSLLDLTRIISETVLRPVSLIDLLHLTPKTLHNALARASPPQASLF